MSRKQKTRRGGAKLKPSGVNDELRKPLQSREGVSRRRWLWLGACAGLAVGGGLGVWAWYGDDEPGPKQFEVVNQYPHDSGAYTQGLVYHEGVLYEGTGWRGESSLRKVELKTGRVLQNVPLHKPDAFGDDDYFGEGIAIWKDRIYQLTWTSGKAFVYDLKTLKRRPAPFEYHGEGWGLTCNGNHLIMSDGSDRLTFRDPDTFKEVFVREAKDGNRSIYQLNELEWVKGEIFANVYEEDWIARISPETGRLLGKIYLTGLLPEKYRGLLRRDEVLNGIAYDAENDRLFVTGKRWPLLFEIRLLGTA